MTFLKGYDTKGEGLKIVTGDENTVSYVNVETKLQSMKWGYKKNVKMSENTVSKKQIVPVYWDRKVIIFVEFIECGATINSEVYHETLIKLQRVIQNKQYDILTLRFSSSMTVYICTWLIILENFRESLDGKFLIILHTAHI